MFLYLHEYFFIPYFLFSIFQHFSPLSLLYLPQSSAHIPLVQMNSTFTHFDTDLNRIQMPCGYFVILTLNLLTWKIWWAPNNASRWQMGFNSAFKELNKPLIHSIFGVRDSFGVEFYVRIRGKVLNHAKVSGVHAIDSPLHFIYNHIEIPEFLNAS